MLKPQRPTRHIQSLDRGIRLLDVVARSPDPLTGVEAADRAEINRSTAWRLLATLEQHGMVERDETGRYGVGIGMFGLAAVTRWGSIARRARPILDRLSSETEATAAVAVVDGGGFEIIDQADGPHSLSVRWIGARLPLNCTSVGKLILASLSEDELDAYLSHPIDARTPLTLTDPIDIREELNEVRRSGVATSIGDYELGVNGISAAAVDARGRPVAFISVTGPDVRLTSDILPDVAELVIAGAAQLAVALGFSARTPHRQGAFRC
jgi:DNA-binding IclR family transcriptional regulator